MVYVPVNGRSRHIMSSRPGLFVCTREGNTVADLKVSYDWLEQSSHNLQAIQRELDNINLDSSVVVSA